MSQGRNECICAYKWCDEDVNEAIIRLPRYEETRKTWLLILGVDPVTFSIENGRVPLVHFSKDDLEAKVKWGKVHQVRVKRNASPIRLPDEEVRMRKLKGMCESYRNEIGVDALSAALCSEEAAHAKTQRALEESKHPAVEAKETSDVRYENLNLAGVERMSRRQVLNLTGIPGYASFMVSAPSISDSQMSLYGCVEVESSHSWVVVTKVDLFVASANTSKLYCSYVISVSFVRTR